jgi:hypothetical protein
MPRLPRVCRPLPIGVEMSKGQDIFHAAIADIEKALDREIEVDDPGCYCDHCIESVLGEYRKEVAKQWLAQRRAK